jgi:hypothetical protein
MVCKKQFKSQKSRMYAKMVPKIVDTTGQRLLGVHSTASHSLLCHGDNLYELGMVERG